MRYQAWAVCNQRLADGETDFGMGTGYLDADGIGPGDQADAWIVTEANKTQTNWDRDQ